MEKAGEKYQVRKFSCNVEGCGRSFAKLDGLTRHFRSIHDPPLSQLQFKTLRDYIVRHVLVDPNENGKIFECPCGSRLGQVKRIRVHLLGLHKKDEIAYHQALAEGIANMRFCQPSDMVASGSVKECVAWPAGDSSVSVGSESTPDIRFRLERLEMYIRSLGVDPEKVAQGNVPILEYMDGFALQAQLGPDASFDAGFEMFRGLNYETGFDPNGLDPLDLEAGFDPNDPNLFDFEVGFDPNDSNLFDFQVGVDPNGSELFDFEMYDS